MDLPDTCRPTHFPLSRSSYSVFPNHTLIPTDSLLTLENDGHFGELERMRHYKQDEKGCVEMSKFIVFGNVIKKYIFFMVVGKHAAVVLQTIADYQIGGVKLKIIGEKLVENLL